MSPSPFRKLGERVVFRGSLISVAEATFEGPDGDTVERDVIHHPGAVSVAPVIGDAGDYSVVLVRQYRAAIEADLLEIPAGKRDVSGEPPEETARRELAEEVGLAPGTLELLTVFQNSAGMTDATTHVYLATDLTPVPRHAHGPEEEAMTVVQVSLADAVADVEAGVITDAKTVIGLLLTGVRLAD